MPYTHIHSGFGQASCSDHVSARLFLLLLMKIFYFLCFVWLVLDNIRNENNNQFQYHTNIMVLSELELHDTAYVEAVLPGPHGPGLTSRLEAMGFLPNKQVRVIRRARMNGPIEVRVGSTTDVAMRRHEADLVVVRKIQTKEPT